MLANPNPNPQQIIAFCLDLERKIFEQAPDKVGYKFLSRSFASLSCH